MIKLFYRNIFRFIVLVLIQVLILDNIQFSGFINPYIYILFILLLPFETPTSLLLILAFLLGLSIDIFNNSLGIHASAAVFMAFLRPYLLDLIAPRDGYEPGSYPGLFCFGFIWFFKYAAILVVAHHTIYFLVEAFSFENFGYTLLKIILSCIFSMALVIISQYLMYRKG